MVAIFKDKKNFFFYAISVLDNKVDSRMDDIQRSSSPRSKMASSYRSRCMCWVLETNLTRKFAADLSLQIFFNSLYLLVRLWWNIQVANLATNFQNLVAKVKNLVALAPVLSAISRPALPIPSVYFSLDRIALCFSLRPQLCRKW